MSVDVDHLARIVPFGLTGTVSHVVGLTANVADFPAPVGATCRIRSSYAEPIEGEVGGFRNGEAIVLPYGTFTGVHRGDRVDLVRSCPVVVTGDALLGRVLDGRGRVIDGGPPAVPTRRRFADRAAMRALDRPPIVEPLATGVR